jgi:hypothetical protein
LRERPLDGTVVRVRPILVLSALVLLTVAAFGVPRHGGGPVLRADTVRTPGVLNPEVTQATIGRTICMQGWTRTVRPPTDYTSELKLRQMREYGVGGSPSDYQEDHLISLELGGHPTDARNLWPEPIERALKVDQTENELNRKVCSGELTLAEAQVEESTLKHTDG